jgi:hypothetical protein
MGLKTLDQIAVECETDKASVFSRTYAKPKNYCVHYERLFAPLRMDPLKLIEIGAAGGESIRMWLEYFPMAQVWGIDIVENTNPYNTAVAKTNPRYTFIHADQSDPVMWACLASDTGAAWDIVIDDGSHFSKDIINSFEAGWQFMRSGGYWAIEDLGCGYGESSIFRSAGYPAHAEFVNALAQGTIQGHKDIESIYVANELIVLRKK